MRIFELLIASASFVLASVASLQAEEIDLALTGEWIEVELDELSGLLKAHASSFDSSPLYDEVSNLIDQEEATRKEIVHGRVRTESRMRAGSVEELIYATEYDPPEIPNQVSLSNVSTDLVPRTSATPTAFETREVGTVLEVDVTSHDERLFLNLAADDISFLGKDFLVNPEAPGGDLLSVMWMPKFYTMRIQTRFVAPFDGTVLVGTFTPSQPEGGTKRWMLFVHTRKIQLHDRETESVEVEEQIRKSNVE